MPRRAHIVSVRFDGLELEQLRAAVVIQLRARAAPVLAASRSLGPFIRAAALRAAADVVPGRFEAPRHTGDAEPRHHRARIGKERAP